MRVIHLNRFEQIREFGICWNDLLDSSKDNHVFMTWEWLTTWWKHYGSDRKLILLIVEDNKKVLAAAPLMETTYRLFGLKLRNIEFVGTPSSDYHTLILTEKNLACARMLVNYVRERLTTWDCIELKDIPEESETARILRSIRREQLKLKERRFDLCPYIPLPERLEEYLLRLGKSTRKKLGQWERRLRREHKVEIKNYDDIGSVEEAMKTFFDLHQKRFQSIGLPGLFANKTFQNFHLEVARRFAERRWLRLYFLTVDDNPISADYAFSYRNRLYDYLSGFDPKYSRYGAGNLSTKHLVRISIEEGLKEFDLMRGDHPYKIHWSTMDRANIELSATRWRPIPKIYEWLLKSNIMPSLSSWLRRRASVSQGVAGYEAWN